MADPSARRWLDIYFNGTNPDFCPPLHMIGAPFQISVWNLLRLIPYGKTTTYGEIASSLAQEKSLPHMSAQAVGGAVGHNEISIIVPCHRVVGKSGSPHRLCRRNRQEDCASETGRSLSRELLRSQI